jgi:hypothetical protein
MAFAPFNTVVPVIAAFVVFIFGYVALFVSLMICFFVCLVIAKGVYEGAKKVRTYAMKSAPAKTFLSSNAALISGLD